MFVQEEGFWEGFTSEWPSSSQDCSPDCPGPSPSAGLWPSTYQPGDRL